MRVASRDDFLARGSLLGARHSDGALLVDYTSHERHRSGALPAHDTYTFKPKLTTQSVFWHDPLIWIGGVVPDSPDADVVIPTGTPLPTGGARSDIAIAAGEAFAAASLDMFQERLLLVGQLTVAGTARLREAATIAGGGPSGWATGTLTAGFLVNDGASFLANGTLTAGSLVNGGNGIQASGTISVSGLLTNDSYIAGRDVNGPGLTVTASSLVNNGNLAASGGDLSVTVAAGGFANLTGSTLTSGEYAAVDGILKLDVGGLIDTIATTVTLGDRTGPIHGALPGASSCPLLSWS